MWLAQDGMPGADAAQIIANDEHLEAAKIMANAGPELRALWLAQQEQPATLSRSTSLLRHGRRQIRPAPAGGRAVRAVVRRHPKLDEADAYTLAVTRLADRKDRGPI